MVRLETLANQMVSFPHSKFRAVLAITLSTNTPNPCRLVYSFGIVLYELYSRREPYEGDDLYETLEKVSDSTIYHRPGVPNNCPKDIQMIMLDCLADNRDLRPSFQFLDGRFKDMDSSRVEPTEIALRPILKDNSLAKGTAGKKVQWDLLEPSSQNDDQIMPTGISPLPDCEVGDVSEVLTCEVNLAGEPTTVDPKLKKKARSSVSEAYFPVELAVDSTDASPESHFQDTQRVVNKATSPGISSLGTTFIDDSAEEFPIFLSNKQDISSKVQGVPVALRQPRRK